MRALFPIHRPRVGISLSASALRLVALRRPWFRPPVLQKVLERPLPDGLLRFSPTESPVADLEALAKELRALIEPVRERTVALSLPTRAMQVGLFRFETFPQAREERERLIQWRFREELHVVLSDTKLVWQTFPAGTTTQVLAVAVRHHLLEQYEEACARAGLIPIAIGFSLFHLVDLYRRTMRGTRRLCVLQWARDEFVLLLFERGRPVFLRSTSLVGGTYDLRREVIGTLQYAADQAAASLEPGAASFPLYLMMEQPVDELLQVLDGSSTLTIPAVSGGWQVEIVPLGWNRVPVRTDSLTGSSCSLAAMAAVVRA